MSRSLLEVRGLTRSFYGIHALSDVDLSVEAGRITGLIGPNGAGKTTLFNCISGVVPPDSGTILFGGREITGWRPDRIASIGLVRTFQMVDDGLSVLLIEHHMDTIAELCDHVVVLAEGKNLAEGSFEALSQNEVVQEAYMGRRR